MKFRVFIEIDVEVEKIEDAEALLDALRQHADEFELPNKKIVDSGLQDQ